MKAAGFKDYGVHPGRLHRSPEARRRSRLDAGLLQPGRRADGRRPDALGRERRGLSQGVPQGAAVLHGGQQLHRQRPATIRISGSARPCTRWPGTATTRLASSLLHAAGSDWAFYNGGNRWTFGDYMYKAAKQFGMKFRLSWHWNACAGDPYYALDCREDDYAWCNASPDGELIPAVHFEQLREGLGDYRRLLTLARLAKEKTGTPAAQAGEKLIAERLAAFKLNQRDHDALFGAAGWNDSAARWTTQSRPCGVVKDSPSSVKVV